MKTCANWKICPAVESRNKQLREMLESHQRAMAEKELEITRLKALLIPQAYQVH